jgi:hypothetical protein
MLFKSILFLLVCAYVYAQMGYMGCINGRARGNKFCSCYSGYSGIHCEIPRNSTKPLVENDKVRTEYKRVGDSYILRVKQTCSASRKQTTIVSGKNYNCNFPLSTKWNQKVEDNDDVFEIDMKEFKKYRCNINKIQYYESPKLEEIDVDDVSLPPTQTQSISSDYSTSPTNNIKSYLRNMTLTTLSKYPAFLSLPTLPGVVITKDCKRDDDICEQTWNVDSVCGLNNPSSLSFTINCREFSDITCQDQSIGNVMLLYDDICLLRKIGYNVFTYLDPDFKDLRQSFSRGETIYSKVSLERCDYTLKNINLDTIKLMESSAITKDGISVNLRVIDKGFSFTMPKVTDGKLTTEIEVVCADGRYANRVDVTIIKSNMVKDYSTYSMFYISLITFYFLLFLIIFFHWLGRKRTEHRWLIYVFFNSIFAYMICNVIKMAFKLGYFKTLDRLWDVLHECFYTITASLFVVMISLMTEIWERKTMVNKNRCLTILSYVSIVMITLRVMITCFDLIMIIFFDYNSYYRVIFSWNNNYYCSSTTSDLYCFKFRNISQKSFSAPRFGKSHLCKYYIGVICDNQRCLLFNVCL